MARNSNRDEFSAATKRLLEKQSGHRCSNPACRRITSAASSDGKSVISIGEASHITAAAPGGPRYDESLSSEERKSHENGIWLCELHAKAVDSKDPYFTVALLKAWKRQANEDTWRSIVEDAPLPPAPSLPTDEALRARLRVSAAADLSVFKKTAAWPASSIPLTLKVDETSEPLGTDALARAVTTFDDLMLVAAPGMGKTTTLFQIADGVIEAQAGSPIIISLGDWATTQDGLIASVLKRAAYAGISEVDFHRAAGAPGVVLLLDGWNELDGAARERARVELVRLKAELPELGLVISTRRQALDIPLAGTRVDLLPLGTEQQMAIAREIRGEAGERLLDQAWRTPGVRELVSIPLYLTSLLALPDGHAFPTTKEEVLRRFVEALERDPGKRSALANATGGFSSSYLEGLASAMTTEGNTAIADTAARAVVNGVSRGLIEHGQLAFAATQPNQLLDALVSVHVLVRSSEAAGLSFQHQQFQEWFASHEVERLMAAAAANPAARQRLQATILDRRPWTEAILFATERMARGDEAQQRACAAGTLAAFDVDPLLCAEIIFRASDEVWNMVGGEIRSRVTRWHTPEKVDRAFRFMLSTGRPEFLDLLWPLLTHENDQVHLRALRAVETFRPSVLGKDAAERFASLPTSVRRNVLSVIASNSGMNGLDLATAAAKADADPDVKIGVAESLFFRRADRHLSDLLRDAGDDVYDRLARISFLEEIGDAEIEQRLAAARQRQQAAGLSSRDRLRVLLRAEPSDSVSSKIISLFADLDIQRGNDQDRHLVWELNERHPRALAEATLLRLRAGRELHYGADDLLAAAGYALEDGDLLGIALSDTGGRDDRADAAASVLGPGAVGAMVDTFLELGSRLRDKNGNFDREVSQRHSNLRHRLARTPGASLAAAVLARSDAAKVEQLAHLADLLSRRSEVDDNRGRPFTAENLETIGKLAQTWADRLLMADGVPRHDKAAIARMIGHAPAAPLLPTLQRLLDDNLVRYHEFRKAAMASQWLDRAAVQEAQHPQMHEYQMALTAIRTPETFDVAVQYLTNEHFGECAARVLAVQWTERNEPRDERRFLGSVDFSMVGARRAARQANSDESCREADAIFAAVESLVADGTTDEQHRQAVTLGSIGARLPHGNRTALFDRLIGFASRRARAGLLLGLILSGENVAIDRIEAGIDETFEEAKTNTWILTESDGYQLRDWLRLLPFATQVKRIPEIIARLPAPQRTPRMLEELIRNIGIASPDDGQDLLIGLADNDPRLFQDYHWRKAAMSFEGERAARRIVDLVLAGRLAENGHDQMRLCNELEGLLRKNPETRAYVHELLRDGPKNREQALLARSLAEDPTTEDVILLVKCEIATSQPFLGWRSIQAAVTSHAPSEDWRGAFEVTPVPATELRKGLLALTKGGGKDDPAARCLTAIDKIRDEYGAPEAEPRHPDLASGRPWPILALDPDAEDAR